MFTAGVKSCGNCTIKTLTRKNVAKTFNMSSKLATYFGNKNGKHVDLNWHILENTNRDRFLSTLNARGVAKASWIVSDDEAQEFMSVFPDIVRDLTDGGPYTDIPEVTKRFATVLEYNVPHGKKHRGLAIVAAYKALESEENLTPEKMKLANILGWCTELMQASLLVEDDIEDSSKFRRGSPCWYTVEGVGLQAINDAQMIENSMHFLLKKYFSNLDCYAPIMELYHNIIMKTRIGQSLDFMCLVNGKPQFNYFTMKMFNTIAEYKTTYHAFHLPIALAMHLAGKSDPEMLQQVDNILLEMGQFYQIENDILDCYGNPLDTGKTGSDIPEGKCTWLVVVALQRATPEQKLLLLQNYGRPESQCESAVRNLYHEMNLFNAYLIYKENSFNLIQAYIKQLHKDLPQDFFLKFSKQIYKQNLN